MARRPSSLPASFAILLMGALLGASMLSWTLFVRPVEVQLPADVPVSTAQPPQLQGSGPNQMAVAERSMFMEALERPLFSKTRRPPSAKSAPQLAAAEPSPDGLSVSGVTIIGRHSRAFILSSDAPKGAWVSEGSMVAGWRLTAISPTGIRLEAQGRSAKLTLYKSSAHATPAASLASTSRTATTAP